MSRQRFVILALAILESTTITLAPATAQKRLSSEVSFSLESPMARTGRVPRAVLDQLAVHPAVREFLGNQRESTAGVLAGFEAAPVHVNTDGVEDLVIRNPSLNGANIGPFWLFARTAHGYKLVFFTRCLGISILRPVAGGYHDLKVSSATAITLSEAWYRFDGKAYRMQKSVRTDLFP